MRTRCTRYKLLTPLVHAQAREEGLCCDADFGGQTVCLTWEVKELEATCAKLQEQLQILWEIAAANITQEQLENARACRLREDE